MQHVGQDSKDSARRRHQQETISNGVDASTSYGYIDPFEGADMFTLSSGLFDTPVDPSWCAVGDPHLPPFPIVNGSYNIGGSAVGAPSIMPCFEETVHPTSLPRRSSMIEGLHSPACDNRTPGKGVDRKARNRTAQRNFRQRQIQLVQDMEDGIGLLQDKRSLLHANNDLLRTQLENLRIENEVLQAAMTRPPSTFVFPQPVSMSSPESDASTIGPSQSSRRASVPLVAAKAGRSGKHGDSRQPIPRRAHKKSKTGCRTCKLRKVKCDETRPLCNNCSRHFTNLKTCDFDELDHTFTELTAESEQQSPAVVLSLEEAWQLLQTSPGYLLDKVDVDEFAKGLRGFGHVEGSTRSFARDQVLTLVKKVSID